MSGKTCTVYRYNDNGDCVGMCGEQATAIYSKDNPNTGPKEPIALTFPRCRAHDSPTTQQKAREQGYEREALD